MAVHSERQFIQRTHAIPVTSLYNILTITTLCVPISCEEKYKLISSQTPCCLQNSFVSFSGFILSVRLTHVYSFHIASQLKQWHIPILNKHKEKHATHWLIYSNDTPFFYLKQSSSADAFCVGIKSAFISAAVVNRMLHILWPSRAPFPAQSLLRWGVILLLFCWGFFCRGLLLSHYPLNLKNLMHKYT